MLIEVHGDDRHKGQRPLVLLLVYSAQLSNTKRYNLWSESVPYSCVAMGNP